MPITRKKITTGHYALRANGVLQGEAWIERKRPNRWRFRWHHEDGPDMVDKTLAAIVYKIERAQ